jgi:hypothetical protein
MAKKLARAKHPRTPAKTSTHFKCAVPPKSAAKQSQLLASNLRQSGESNNSEPFFMPDKKLPPVKSQQNTHTLWNLTKNTWDYSTMMTPKPNWVSYFTLI